MAAWAAWPISRMKAFDAFAEFVTRALVPAKAKRLTELASSKKGQRKVLDGLCHELENAIRNKAIRVEDYSQLWDQPCFVFHSRLGFGAEFETLRDAYHELALEDGWLIVMRDATTGIHRPES